MTAVFVQVSPEQVSFLEANPSTAEALFQPGGASPLAAMGELSEKMQERMRATGPQMLAKTLASLDPRLRQQLEQKLGATTGQLASGEGGDALLKLIQQRREQALEMKATGQQRLSRLDLDKEWHGVHYLLCGEAEPGETLISNAVLGGKPLGDDDEGFSGYGPARYFSAVEVAELGKVLSSPEIESGARARFDVTMMNKLKIYPGFRPQDSEPLIDRLRQLREFYADAAKNGKAVVTCLV
jgi:hypothetical protein